MSEIHPPAIPPAIPATSNPASIPTSAPSESEQTASSLKFFSWVLRLGIIPCLMTMAGNNFRGWTECILLWGIIVILVIGSYVLAGLRQIILNTAK